MNSTIGKLTRAFIVFFMFLGNTHLTAAAEPTEEQEYTVKLAFLYNFTKFINWPEEAFSSASAPFVFGVIGDNPFDNIPEKLRDKKVQGRTILVKPVVSESELKSCHLLYISASEKTHLFEIMKQLGPFVLTVGDFNGFPEAGGAINFLIVKHKVRFEINPSAMKKAGLTASSQLLKLAQKIYRN